jgi:lipopolysaccharide/colanic/teichoic acid biosynthesis glycosyltransferase
MVTAAPHRRPWYERQGRRPLPVETDEIRYKRILDVILALIVLPAVLPLLALCAAAIRLDTPGSIFFMQERTGQGGRRFRMFKLRTMVQNAHEIKDQFAYLNDLKAPDFKILDDPRVTRVGRVLRKTSLDELPQVFNVLRGDMTFVGPRPTSFSSSTYSDWHTARLEAKSGITGLWQVSGRNDLEFDERVRLDIAYQRHQCMWLDLQILARTVVAVITRRGAN